MDIIAPIAFSHPRHCRPGILLAALLGALLPSPTLNGQITVGKNVHVSKAREGTPHYEHLAGSDPANPRRMMACSMYSDPTRTKTHSVLYTSHDGGQSWKETLALSDANMVGDPVCEFGLGDTAYFVVLSLQDTTSHMYVYRSTDAGLTWGKDPADLKFIDRENLVVDRTGGKYHGRVYINGTGGIDGVGGEHTAAATLFRSMDGGKSFDLPTQRAAFPPGHVVGMGNSVVLSDGTLLTLFGHAKRMSDLSDETNMRLQPNSNLTVAISSDGGKSYGKVVVVAPWYMARDRHQGSHIPWMAVDATNGPFRDRVYAVWNDFKNERLEVFLSYSSDKGKTWSRAVRVHADDRIHSDPKRGPDETMPLVAVNRDGIVGVAWYDHRDHPDNLGWYLRFSASLDGGETFLPSVRVSTSPNNFNTRERWPVTARSSGGGTSGGGASTDPRLSVTVGIHHFYLSSGHTSGLVLGPNGVFQPVWSDNRTGVSQLWTAPVTVTGTVVKNGSSELASLGEVSSKVKLEVETVTYDRATNNGVLRARLENTSKSDTIRGPLKIRVIDVASDVGVPTLTNSDNKKETIGAVFDFSSLIPNGMLAPGAKSQSREIRFHLTDLRPVVEGEQMRLGLIRLDARVLGKAAPAKDSASK
jgi:hypothetical protein